MKPMLTLKRIEATVIRVIQKVTGESGITVDDSLDTDLEITDTDLTDIQEWLEDEFDLDLDLREMTTIEDIVTSIADQLLD